MEETQARNHELEKKQRKFDSEMCGQQAETTQHKIDKDKSIREKENLQKIDKTALARAHWFLKQNGLFNPRSILHGLTDAMKFCRKMRQMVCKDFDWTRK